MILIDNILIKRLCNTGKINIGGVFFEIEQDFYDYIIIGKYTIIFR